MDENEKQMRQDRYCEILAEETAAWRKHMAEWVLAAMEGNVEVDGLAIPEVVVTLAVGLRECADMHAHGTALERLNVERANETAAVSTTTGDADEICDEHADALAEIEDELSGMRLVELQERAIDAGVSKYGPKSRLVGRIAKALVASVTHAKE